MESNFNSTAQAKVAVDDFMQAELVWYRTFDALDNSAWGQYWYPGVYLCIEVGMVLFYLYIRQFKIKLRQYRTFNLVIDER